MRCVGGSPALSPDARRALQLAAGGLDTHDIAEALGWDPDAVLLCLAGTLGTLGAGSVPDAVARAIELGLIEPPTA